MRRHYFKLAVEPSDVEPSIIFNLKNNYYDCLIILTHMIDLTEDFQTSGLDDLSLSSLSSFWPVFLAG
jgi:hypothetical protein